jgi:hypothetical protein
LVVVDKCNLLDANYSCKSFLFSFCGLREYIFRKNQREHV